MLRIKWITAVTTDNSSGNEDDNARVHDGNTGSRGTKNKNIVKSHSRSLRQRTVRRDSNKELNKEDDKQKVACVS